MTVLVVCASKHGATAEMAERIAQKITAAGQRAEVRPVVQAGDVEDYAGLVIGSATYLGHWLKEATAFVHEHTDLLLRRPVWLFSSGPLGEEETDASGHDVRVAAEPKEIAGFLDTIHFRDWDEVERWAAGIAAQMIQLREAPTDKRS